MYSIFESDVKAQLEAIDSLQESQLLSESGRSCFLNALNEIVGSTVKSTFIHLLCEEVAPENPFVKMDPALMTIEQREKAKKSIRNKLETGILVPTEPLLRVTRRKLARLTEAFSEMLKRMSAHRQEICDELGKERLFTHIEDIIFSAGDVHNKGRTVMILVTDTGRLVYKPRDMRGDRHICELAERYFSDVVGIPKCAAFGSSFGVCEYIEKERSQGTEAARAFYWNLGGTAAFLKMMGSTDMHMENVVCSGGKPYILDLETILKPVYLNRNYEMLHPELSKLKESSLYLSGLFPSIHDGKEYSVMMNIKEEGSVPEIDGRRITVLEYPDEFLEGYESVYCRILKNREEIRDFLCRTASEILSRKLLRNTQSYSDCLLKLDHYQALSSEDQYNKTAEKLRTILTTRIRPEFEGTAECEYEQLLSGSIPYFYTYGDSRDLCSEGKVVLHGIFEKSGLQHALENLDGMNEKDKSFDLGLLKRVIAQYPGTDTKESKKLSFPERTKEVLAPDLALREAKELFEKVLQMGIVSPEGRTYWGYLNDGDYAFRFCEIGLINGLTGIALFTSAYAAVTENREDQQIAEAVRDGLFQDISAWIEYLENGPGTPLDVPPPGESEGAGGILKGLSLIKRYTPDERISKIQEKVLESLGRKALPVCEYPDRMSGLAGLLSALCCFEEYHGEKELICEIADRLLEMKNLEYKGAILWKSTAKTPLSGAGHGMAGIAEALFRAAALTGNDRYLAAAKEAIAYECRTYQEKLGTWPDLREIPPVGFMHGYCSGAPGIGIMMEHIRKAGYDDPDVRRCSELAAQAADRLPLNRRDHLCCGNSAVAEYYMTTGQMEKAGQVLQAMYSSKERSGNYRYLPEKYYNAETPSLFYGTSGIGYEMLRYYCPDRILSIL